jgi:DNA-directed RNA polymerase specialized sigma24 family protein
MPIVPAELSDRLQAIDAALAARVACGDAAALGPLYGRHRGRVCRFALLWSGQPAVAADVTQDVFVHLLTRGADDDVARGPLAPWLLGVARSFVYRRAELDARLVPDDDVEVSAPRLGPPAPEEAGASRRGPRR